MNFLYPQNAGNLLSGWEIPGFLKGTCFMENRGFLYIVSYTLNNSIHTDSCKSRAKWRVSDSENILLVWNCVKWTPSVNNPSKLLGNSSLAWLFAYRIIALFTECVESTAAWLSLQPFP
jgi:hypothetical protein